MSQHNNLLVTDQAASIIEDIDTKFSRLYTVNK